MAATNLRLPPDRLGAWGLWPSGQIATLHAPKKRTVLVADYDGGTDTTEVDAPHLLLIRDYLYEFSDETHSIRPWRVLNVNINGHVCYGDNRPQTPAQFWSQYWSGLHTADLTETLKERYLHTCSEEDCSCEITHECENPCDHCPCANGDCECRVLCPCADSSCDCDTEGLLPALVDFCREFKNKGLWEEWSIRKFPIPPEAVAVSPDYRTWQDASGASFPMPAEYTLLLDERDAYAEEWRLLRGM